MAKKALIITVLAVFCAASFAMAADEAKKPAPMARQMPPKSEFSMISGKIESVNSSDPANVSITVKDNKDGVSRTVSVMPWTNITKSAEISELKAGEAVRVMARKAQDKDVAMGIMFGKLPTPPPQKHVPPQAVAQAKGPAKK